MTPEIVPSGNTSLPRAPSPLGMGRDYGAVDGLGTPYIYPPVLGGPTGGGVNKKPLLQVGPGFQAVGLTLLLGRESPFSRGLKVTLTRDL